MKTPEFFSNIFYFSQEDLNLFERFLESSVFNEESAQILVFRVIKKNMKFVVSKKFHMLRNKIKKMTGFNDNTINKILSYLNDNYFEYMKYRGYSRNDFYQDLGKCEYIMYTGNYSILHQEIEGVKRKLDRLENYDHNFFYKMNEVNILELAAFIYTEKIFDPDNKKETLKVILFDSTINTIVYTIARIVMNYTNYMSRNFTNRKNIEKFPVDPNMYFEFIKSQEYNNFSKFQQTTIEMFYRLFKMFEDFESDENYDNFKEYFFSNHKSFNKDLQRILINFMMNYCNIRQRSYDSNKYYVLEGLNILYEFIDKEFYKNDRSDYLHSYPYRNYVMSALMAKEKEKLIRFIETQTSKLHQSDRIMMRAFAFANYHYLMENYELALRYALKIKKPKQILKYDIWNLRIKANYKLNKYDEVEAIMHNYLESVKRDTFLTREDEKRFKNMLFCVRKLISAEAQYLKTKDLTDFEFIVRYSYEEELLSLREWLRETATDFLKKHSKTNTEITYKSS